MTKGQAFLLVLLLAIGGSGGWLIQRSAAEVNKPVVGQLASTEVDLLGLEKIAEESCFCERREGTDSNCEAKFERARQNLLTELYGDSLPSPVEEWGAACAPVSTEIECFEFTDGRKCIVVGYNVNAASSEFENRSVCSKEEARAIELAFDQEGFNGVDKMLHRIQAGVDFPKTAPGSGCVG